MAEDNKLDAQENKSKKENEEKKKKKKGQEDEIVEEGEKKAEKLVGKKAGEEEKTKGEKTTPPRRGIPYLGLPSKTEAGKIADAMQKLVESILALAEEEREKYLKTREQQQKQEKSPFAMLWYKTNDESVIDLMQKEFKDDSRMKADENNISFKLKDGGELKVDDKGVITSSNFTKDAKQFIEDAIDKLADPKDRFVFGKETEKSGTGDLYFKCIEKGVNAANIKEVNLTKPENVENSIKLLENGQFSNLSDYQPSDTIKEKVKQLEEKELKEENKVNGEEQQNNNNTPTFNMGNRSK